MCNKNISMREEKGGKGKNEVMPPEVPKLLKISTFRTNSVRKIPSRINTKKRKWHLSHVYNNIML